MKIFKPNFWNKRNNIFAFLLMPISILLQAVNKVRQKFIYSKEFSIPIICVGNIYIGGTGKTPLSILIASELKKYKKNPIIIKKYYKNHRDEHNLIRKNFGKLILNKNRENALMEAQRRRFGVAILDDGFQDFTIKKNLNILCFNSRQLIGNGLTFPSGPLREGLESIKKAQILIINGNKNKIFEKRISLISNKVSIYYSKYKPLNIRYFKGKKLFGFAGIGNPENFFQILDENKINLKDKIAFPDHYNFSRLEIQKMINFSQKKNMELITTEKDYYRIKHYGFKKIHYLKVKLDIIKKAKFINEIKKSL